MKSPRTGKTSAGGGAVHGHPTRGRITGRRTGSGGPANPKGVKVKKRRVISRRKRKTAQNHHRRTLSLNMIRGDQSMADHGKFGRKGPYPEWAAPRLKVHDFVDFKALPAPPEVIDYASKVPAWPMYLNDSIGDCTAATVGHEIEAWTRYAQAAEVSISDNDVLHLYEATGGYNPNDPSTDNGAVIQDVLDYWHKTGVAGHKIVAFAKLENYSRTELRQALNLFGSVYLGINCPQSALDQFNNGDPWTYEPGSPIAGGHAIPLQAWYHNKYNPATVITWGQAQRVGGRFIDRYVEEAWVIITEDWLNAQGESPSGLNLQQLSEDYTLLTGRVNAKLPPNRLSDADVRDWQQAAASPKHELRETGRGFIYRVKEFLLGL